MGPSSLADLLQARGIAVVRELVKLGIVHAQNMELVQHLRLLAAVLEVV